VNNVKSYLIGQNNVGQIFRHLNKFRYFCLVKQPEDASFRGQNLRRAQLFVGHNFSSDIIFVTFEKFRHFCPTFFFV